MNRRTVLLVDTDETVLTGLAEILGTAGHTVVSCRCFEDGKRYLQTDTPHAIVADVRLGAFNGLHLVLLAKDRAPSTTAVLYSGQEDSGLSGEAAATGATCLEKGTLSTRLIPHLDAMWDSVAPPERSRPKQGAK